MSPKKKTKNKKTKQSIKKKGVQPKKKRGFREHLKPKFLEVFKKEGRIKTACDSMNLSRSTVDLWRRNDPAFADAIRQRDEDLHEDLHLMAVKRAKGFKVPFLLNGQPMLDAKGKPIMKEVHSDYLLAKLLEDYRKRSESRDKSQLENQFIEKVFQSFMGALKRNGFTNCPNCKKPTNFMEQMAKDFKDQYLKLGGSLE